MVLTIMVYGPYTTDYLRNGAYCCEGYVFPPVSLIKFNAVKSISTEPQMIQGFKFILILSIATLFLGAISLTGQVLPSHNGAAAMDGQMPQMQENDTPSFLLTVNPLKAHARPGDPVDCAVTIEPRNGFEDPVYLWLEVDAGPVFKGTYNAGVMNPPYPRTYEYRVVIPPKSPAPLTVYGTLSAVGGGYTEEVDLVLFIEK